MTIEYLDAGNLEEALDFAEKSHKDSAWQDYQFKREILRKNLLEMIGNPQYFTCLYRKDSTLVGYWFATLSSFLFSDVLLGMENGIYITPEHRGGKVAFSMWLAFKEWCDKNNAEPLAEIQFGDNESNQAAYTFFSRIGMIECGKIFRGGRHGLRQ